MSLPTFGVRELYGPSEHGLVSLTSSQYDSTIRSYPSSALTYIDIDDGECVTIGSGFELQQRLDEPPQPERPSRPRPVSAVSTPGPDQKIHIFDIQRTVESLTVWRDHAAYSSKSPATSPPVSLHRDGPVARQAQTASATIQPVPELSPSPLSAQTEQKALSTEPSKNILQNVDEVLQTACKGLETHIGGFASFLDMTAAALQAAAQKTRAADTSPVESLLNGLKKVLVEVGQVGLEVLREFEPQSQTSQPLSAVQKDNTSSSSSSVSTKLDSAETGSSTRKVSFVNEHSESTVSPIFSAIFKSPEASTSGSAPSIQNLLTSKDPVRLQSTPYRSFPNRPAPAACVKSPQISNKKDQTLMDDDSANAEFTARFPPLASLKRAKTVGSLRNASVRDEQNSTNECTKTALTRYPSIDQLESRRAAAEAPSVRHWRRTTTNKSSSTHAQDLAKDRSLRGYRKPAVDCEPDSGMNPTQAPEKSKQVTGALPGAAAGALPGLWRQKSTSVPDPSLYESSGEFFDRMAAADSQKRKSPDLSCRNTTPPVDPFAPSTGGLRRARTVTASNPAARLNGPFDPMNVAPNARHHSTMPQRSLTQHRSPRSQPVPSVSAMAANNNTLWNNFNRGVPVLSPPNPSYGAFGQPSMPGAFPYPPVPQSQVQSVRHMRSEPNFGHQENVDVKVNDCVKTLQNMGYGVGNLYEGARLPIYAGAAAGDVLEAIDMIEEDRCAARDMMV